VPFHAVDLPDGRPVALLAETGRPLDGAAEELARAGFPVVVAFRADARGASTIAFYAAPDDDDALVEAVAATWAVKALGGWDESPIIVVIVEGSSRPDWWWSARGRLRGDARWAVEAWPMRRGAWRTVVDEAQVGQSLLLCDVDWMKAYNDLHGFADGDLAIARVYGCIEAAALAAGASFVRVAGDELALLVDAPIESAVALAETVRREVEALGIPLLHPAMPTVSQLTVSVGVVPVRDVPTLGRSAERALDEAKRLGRNRVWRADASGD
jgi:diguanylate cyclase (GGDEF)-like protein